MKREFSNAKVQTSTSAKTRNLSKLLLAVILSVILFGGAMFLLFANHSAPVSTALAANSLKTLPTTLTEAPTFTYDSSARTVTGTDQTINGYNFKDDVYKAFTKTNKKIGDVTYPYVVTLITYTPTTPTQVVIPSQIKIGENTYQVVIDCSNNGTNPFFANKSVVASISFANIGETKVLATNCSYMFYNCSKLTSLDVSNFNTSNVKSMFEMFSDCSSLTSLDLSSFDTSNITNMSSMFSYCAKLTTLDLSKFDTSSVTDMHSMFYNCSKLTSLDLSDFDTSKVTSMWNMFVKCSASITFPANFGSAATNMSKMFDGYTGTSLDLSKFDTSSVTDMGFMFNGCSASITFPANFGSAAIYMSYMFKEYKGTSLDLSNFNTSNVRNMGSMFDGCSSLTSLDLSNFNTSNVTNMSGMFYNCSKLTNLDLSKFDTSSVTNMDSMFYNCSNLTTIFLPKVYSEIFDISLPATFYLESNNSVVGKTLNSFSDYASTESTKSKIVKGNYIFEIVVQSEYGTISDGTKTSVERLAYMCSSSTTYTITDNTITFGTVTITATPNENCTFSGFYSSKTATSPISASQSIKANTTIYARFANSQSIAPQFSVSSSTLTGVDSAYTLPDGSTYDFTKDKYTFSIRNTVIGSSTTAKDYVFITRYTSTDTTQVVVPSQMIIDGINYQVVIDCSGCTYNDLFFANNSAVTNISFAGIGETKVLATNCRGMFYSCSSLTSLDLSNFDTSSVTIMEDMFYDCSILTSLNLSTFDTSSVTIMEDMFRNCSSLTSLDVSNFDTSKVTNMQYMFSNCSASITFPANFGSAATNMSYMFSFYKGNSLDLSNFNTSNVTNMRYMFATGVWNSEKRIYESALSKIVFGENFNTSKVTNMSDMFQGCSSLTSLDVSNLDTSNVNDMSSMFSYCYSFTSAGVNTAEKTYDLNFGETFDTSNVTSMGNMFSYCSKLTSLDVSNFDTSNVTDMRCMFSDCSKLTSAGVNTAEKTYDLNFGPNFNTSKVTDMYAMFSGCSSLISLDLSSFDTSNVTDMEYMFSDCSSLISLDLSSFDTSNVTRTGDMFLNCTSLETLLCTNMKFPADSSLLFSDLTALKTLDLSNADMSAVTNKSDIFLNCSSLETLKCTNMKFPADSSALFKGLSSLKTLDLSNADTSNVTNMSNMFVNCTSFTTLDLSSFDTSNVTDMSGMFIGTKANTLNLSSFVFKSDCNVSNMFGGQAVSDDEIVAMLFDAENGMVTMFNGISTMADDVVAMAPDWANHKGQITKLATDVTEEQFRSMTSQEKEVFYDDMIDKTCVLFCLMMYMQTGDTSFVPTPEKLATVRQMDKVNNTKAKFDGNLNAVFAEFENIILPATVNRLEIALPAGDYAVDGTDYAYTTLKGYNDLKTVNGTSYQPGATLQNKAHAPETPIEPTPTETGVATDLLFALSGAVVVAVFAVAVAHLGKKKRVVRK